MFIFEKIFLAIIIIICLFLVGVGVSPGLGQVVKGEDYVAIASYCGEHQEDISFPEGAKVTVLEKNSTGWWVVR